MSADAIALGCLTAAGIVFALLTWRTWGSVPEDIGYDLSAAARTAGGALPYVDYTYSYGPLAPLGLGGIFAAFGTGLEAAAAFGAVLAGAIVAATYGVARQHVGPLAAAIAAAVVLPVAFTSGGGSPIFDFVLPHSYSAPLASLATLGMLAALTAFARGGSKHLLLLAGLALGLIALARPEAALAPAAATALWLVLRGRRPPGARASLAAAARIAGAALALAVAGYAPFLLAVSIDELVFTNLYPVDVLRAGGNAVLSDTAPFTFGSALELVGWGALYAALVCVLVGAGRAFDARNRTGLLVAGAGALAFAFLAVVTGGGPSGALHHVTELAYRPIPLIAAALLALALRPALRRGETWTVAQQADLLLAAFLLAASIRAYALFLPGSTAIYTFPLAAIVLVRLHAGLSSRRGVRLAGLAWIALAACAVALLGLRDARHETFTVQAANGTLRTTPAQGEPFAAALRVIERETAPGDAVLVAPQLTALEVLSGRRSALPQLSLLPGALPDAEAEREAIERLEAAGVRLAVLDRRSLTEYGNGAFGATFDRVLGEWVKTHFVRVATVRGAGERSLELDIWKWRTE